MAIPSLAYDAIRRISSQTDTLMLCLLAVSSARKGKKDRTKIQKEKNMEGI